MAKGKLSVVLITGLLAACSNGSDNQRAPDELPLPSESAAGATAQPAAAGAPAAAASVAGSEPEATSETATATVPNGEGSGQSPPAADATPDETPADGALADTPPTPVDIFEVMQAGGWELSSEADLADYLPIPPRSEGQVARFARGADSVSIARVTYRAAVFADPHEGWIRERMALLPDAHERVVRRGATVVHIRAESDAAAEAAVQLFETALAAPIDEEDG